MVGSSDALAHHPVVSFCLWHMVLGWNVVHFDIQFIFNRFHERLELWVTAESLQPIPGRVDSAGGLINTAIDFVGCSISEMCDGTCSEVEYDTCEKRDAVHEEQITAPSQMLVLL
jgi:hypothetical protein